MKSNLEQNIKDIFDKYELPYNQNAWNNLNEKLDKIQGTDNTPKSLSKPGLKLISGITGFVMVATVSLFYFMNINENTNQTAAVSNSVPPSLEKSEKKDQNKATLNKIIEEELSNQNNQKNKTRQFQQKANEKQEQHVAFNKSERTHETAGNEKRSSHQSQKNPFQSAPFGNNNNSELPTPVVPLSGKQEAQIKFPQNEWKLCEGNKISIPNKNSVELMLVSPGGEEIIIPANQTIEYHTSEVGTYIISSKSDASNTSSFIVNEAPKLDFLINEEIKYENGIPSIPVETYSDGTNFEWSFEGSSRKQYGTKATAHFYKKGTHEIILTSKNAAGCKGTITKTVTIDEDYNLLAPSGFMPQSSDPRKNRFIPIALTLRNTDFKMYIMEPRTGTIIFETTSTEGWDGVDRNTRQLVEENKSYIWKVVLANPEPEERKEYTGVLVRL